MNSGDQVPGTSVKPWVCCFCSKSYHRSDVLRRHYARCSSRGQQSIPERLKKGKKSAACDACARSKVRCDLECPCETCLSHGYECTYFRALLRPAQQIPLQNDSDAGHAQNGQYKESATLSVGHAQPDQRKISLSFLLNYSDPKNTTISEAFHPGFTARLSQDVGEDVPEHALSSLDETDTFVPSETVNDLCSRQNFVNHDINRTAPESEEWLDAWDDTESPMLGVPWPDVHPCNKLIDSLTQFTLSLPVGHLEKAPIEKLGKSSTLFSAQGLERLIELYFREWGPHTPIIHQGTFCPYDTVPHLLLTMMLIGATLSPSADEVGLANNMIDLADDYVFSNPIFQSVIAGCRQREVFSAKETFQALQAVFLMSQIQLRKASISKRREIRKNRFDQIILACRALGLLESKNSFWHSKMPFHWEVYGVSESRIRLICGIFNLDASFTILYNSSPRLFAEEMEVDMPGPLQAFIATSPGEADQAASESRESEHLTLATLCEILMRIDLEVETTSVKLKKLTILDLFIVVLGLLQLLWLSPYKPTKVDTICRVSQALIRWKIAWDHQNLILTAQELENYGFMRVAALEFWQLAMLMVKKGKTRLDDTMLSANNPSASEEVSVHAILKQIDKGGL